MMSDQIFSALVQQTWQVALLAAVVWVATRLFAKDRPHLAHALWALVLIKCIVPPVWGSSISPFSWLSSSSAISQQLPAEYPIAASVELAAVQENSLAAAVESSPANSVKTLVTEQQSAEIPARSKSPAIETLSKAFPMTTEPGKKRIQQEANAGFSMKSVVLSGWLAGVVVGLLATVIRFGLFIAWLRRSAAANDTQIDNVVQQLAKRLNIKRPVRVAVLKNSVGPAVLGVIRPTILLPAAIVAGKSALELEPLLAHELIHVRRGDLWWAMLQTLATSLFWFHPLVWLASRAVTRESERSCDEETVACLGCPPAVYARGLLEVLEQKHLLHVAPALPGVRPVDVTTARLERVMRLGNGIHSRTPVWTWALLLVCSASVLPGAKLIWAQDVTPSEPPVSSGQSTRLFDIKPKDIDSGDAVQDDEVTVSIDVRDLLTAIRNSKPKNKTAEQILLAEARIPNLNVDGTYSATKDAKMSIADNMLVLSGSAEKVEGTSKVIGALRKYGFGQVIVESRFVNLAASELGSLEARWSLAEANTDAQSAFEPIETGEAQFKVQQAAFADFEDDGVSRIKATSHVGRISPVLYSVLNAEQSKSLVEQLGQSKGASSMQAPTCTLFNGQEALISDIDSMPFVVGMESMGITDAGSVEPSLQVQSTDGRTFTFVPKGDGTDAPRPAIQVIDKGTRVFIKPVVRGNTVNVACSVQMTKIGTVDHLELSSESDESEPLAIQMPTVASTRIDIRHQLPVGHSLLLNTITNDAQGNANASIAMLTFRHIANTWESEHPVASLAPAKKDAVPTKQAPSFNVRITKPLPASADSPSEDILVIRSTDNATLANGQPRIQTLEIFGHPVQLEGEVRLELDSDRALFRGKNVSFNVEPLTVSGDEGEIEILPLPPSEIAGDDEDVFVRRIVVTGNVKLDYEERVQGSADKLQFAFDYHDDFSFQAEGTVKVHIENETQAATSMEIGETYDIEADRLTYPNEKGQLVVEGKARVTRKSADTEAINFRADRVEWNMETNEINATNQQN